MAKKTNDAQNQPEVIIEDAINQSESFLYTHGKKLLIALAVIVVVVGGYFAYDQLYKVPGQEKASAMMFMAEQAFAQDSFQSALNGDGSTAGFLEVIKQYGSTPQANLAHHYAGVCYMHMGEYNNALLHLTAYKAVDGPTAVIINAQNLGLQGDAYLQMGDNAKAASMYEQAIASSDNAFSTPYYLFKAAGLYQSMGDNAKALAAYTRIRNEYSGSIEAQNINKYIGQIEQL